MRVTLSINGEYTVGQETLTGFQISGTNCSSQLNRRIMELIDNLNGYSNGDAELPLEVELVERENGAIWDLIKPKLTFGKILDTPAPTPTPKRK